MAYDALFKELLRAFFREFMERFFPEEAARLDFSQITFLEQELATDVGSGRQRTLDLIAQLRTRSGDAELVLIHIEFEAKYERDFPPLMFEHYGMLRRRYRLGGCAGGARGPPGSRPGRGESEESSSDRARAAG